MPDPSLSRLLPDEPPPPRRVLVEEHRHPPACSCRCFRRGWIQGQRAERERVERELIGLSLFVPLLAWLAVGLATVVAWLKWMG